MNPLFKKIEDNGRIVVIAILMTSLYTLSFHSFVSFSFHGKSSQSFQEQTKFSTSESTTINSYLRKDANIEELARNLTFKTILNDNYDIPSNNFFKQLFSIINK